MEQSERGPAIAEFRAELRAWLDRNADELAPAFAPPGTLDEQIAQMRRVTGRLYDEATVLRVALAYERATTWNSVKPPLTTGTPVV